MVGGGIVVSIFLICVRKVCRWILCAWNGEIASIIEFPVGFSVVKASAGAIRGDFGDRLKILGAKEWWYSIVMHVEVRGDALSVTATLV